MPKEKSIQSIERQERLNRRNKLKDNTSIPYQTTSRKYTDSFIFKYNRRHHLANFNHSLK